MLYSILEGDSANEAPPPFVGPMSVVVIFLADAQARMQREAPAAREQFQESLIPAVAELGNFDSALVMAHRMLEQPTGVTRYGLRFSPAYSKLWGRSEFERLLADSTLPPR
jgi:hypothetical protein